MWINVFLVTHASSSNQLLILTVFNSISSNDTYSDFQDEDSLVAQMSSAYKDLDLEAGQIDPSSATSAAVLLDIAFKSGTKVKHLLIFCFAFLWSKLSYRVDGCHNYFRWSSSIL